MRRYLQDVPLLGSAEPAQPQDTVGWARASAEAREAPGNAAEFMTEPNPGRRRRCPLKASWPGMWTWRQRRPGWTLASEPARQPRPPETLVRMSQDAPLIVTAAPKLLQRGADFDRAAC